MGGEQKSGHSKNCVDGGKIRGGEASNPYSGAGQINLQRSKIPSQTSKTVLAGGGRGGNPWTESLWKKKTVHFSSPGSDASVVSSFLITRKKMS